MRRSIAIVVIGGTVVALAVALLWFRDRDEATSAKRTERARDQLALLQRGTAAPSDLPVWFGVPAAPARRIAGRVTFDSEPVEGARVVLSSALDRAGIADVVERRTGADGRFDFGELPAATYMIGASAPERTAAVVRVDLADPTLAPPPDALELRLRGCTATLYGTVLDGSGGVVGHARVLRQNAIGPEVDAQGRYELCLPRADEEIRFTADGYGDVVLTVHARGRVRRDVALVPEATIVGKVVRGDDDQPVPGALIEAFPREWGPDRPGSRQTVAGPDGRFRLDRLAPGVFRLSARHEGMRSAPGRSYVLAEAGEQSRDVVLRLEPTARIRGVVQSGGKPVAGATVQAVRESPLAYSRRATSQADGSFVLDDVAFGEVVFTVPGYEVRSPQSYAVQSGTEHDDVVIEVTEMGAIRGIVTRGGRPVVGARVCCGPFGATRIARSDDDGRYAFEGLAAGDYDIGAQTDDAFARTIKVALRAGEQRDVDIELSLAGTITGDVVDQGGEPVEGATVRYVHEGTGDLCETVTDSDGAYRCGAMTGGGRYRARVFASADAQSPYRPAEGSPFPEVSLEDGTSVVDNVRIRVEREQLSVSGRVVDADGGPVPDARVRALAVVKGKPPRFPSWRPLPSAVTDVEGRFAIGGLTAGNYAVHARSAGGGEAVAAQVTAGADDVTLVLKRPGVIEGTLVGFAQPPYVYASTVESTFRLEAAIVDGERFRVVGLRPGRYLVNAQTAIEGQAKLVEVRAGETAQVVLTAKGRGAIRGRVLEFRTRAPVPAAVCHALTSAGGIEGITNWDATTSPKSDEQGVVVIDPAPAGSVIVNCLGASPRYSPASAQVQVPKGDEAQVELLTVENQAEQFTSVGMEFAFRRADPIVAAVEADGPAGKAGIRAGDLVTAVDGTSVEGLNGFGVLYLVCGRPAGKRVTVTVQRGGESLTMAMTTVARSEW